MGTHKLIDQAKISCSSDEAARSYFSLTCIEWKKH